MESTQIRKKRSCKGYTLVELMAVIAIMAALAAASAGIYSGYVERAREAELYETAEQIKNALAICEAQYGEAGGSDASVFWSEAFLAPAQSSGQRPVSLCGNNDRGLYRLFPEDKTEWGRAVFYCRFYVFHGRI